MIVFDLICDAGQHCFEGWFASSQDFAAQQERGLVACPQCGSSDVTKAPMAPSVGRKGNQLAPFGGARPAHQATKPVKGGTLPPEAARMVQALHAMQTEALKHSRWVGSDFTEQSRAMHYGERDAENIHGEATLEQAAALAEEGIAVAPLPFPVAPPGKAN